MKPSASLKEKRSEVERILRNYPLISNVRVFGSVSRNQDGEDSDLDLFVDAAPGATLFHLGGLREELAELLGVAVNIVTSGTDLHAIMKANVEKDMRPL